MLTLLLCAASGAVGYWLGRQEQENQRPRRRNSSFEDETRRAPQDDEAFQKLVSRSEGDPDDVVRMRFVHINDVYIMDNLPKLRKLLDDCSCGLRRENLIVSIGGDLLSPYPLSTLDKGRGMVDVMLESGVQYACFGNHEADVGLPALKKRLERWHERGGVWINTNMPDLLPELQLPSYASVVGLSKDGHHSRQVCLVGVCTKDPGLYNAPEDFGGAVYTALDCNEAAKAKSQKLMEAHLEDDDAKKVDAVVALTHQDLEFDMELAKTATSVGICAVLGGHDHTEYMARHHGCVVLKAGMDAKNAAVMDLLWNTEDTAPKVDSYQLISLSKFTSSKAVYRSMEKHMQKLWKMEQRKALVHLTVFPAHTIMSSKEIRKKQTTLGSFLCSALRDEMEVDCVLFDAGNIRGDRDYVPNPEHYLGDLWTFTLADLEQELPWSSEMVIIVLPGHQLSRAVHVSRTVKHGSGGFLQADGSVEVDPQTSEVQRVGNEPIDVERVYRIGVMHASLAGMNDNPVFKEWKQTHIMPQEDSGKPAKELLKRQFARRMWDKMPEFHEINVSQSGILSREEVRSAYVGTFPRCPDQAVDACMDQLLSVADADDSGEVTPSNYEAIFRLPTWITLAYFSKEEAMTSKMSSRQQTKMGTFLCDGLKKELEVDCVLFDGGNIRGDRNYSPKPGHHRGSKWAFTVSDLRRELPWPSEMAVVEMEGLRISEAVRVSRCKVSTPSRRLHSKVPNIAGLFKRIESSVQVQGGYLQCDSGIEVSLDCSVSRIDGEPLEPARRYKVAVLYNALMGMNQNIIFEQWRNDGNTVSGQCPPARELLMRHFLRRLWRLTETELHIQKGEDISRDKLLAAISKVWPRAGGNMRRSLLRRLLSTVVTEGGSRGFKSSGITHMEYQKTLSKVSHELVEGQDYEREGNE